MEQTVAPTTALCSLQEVKEWLGIIGTNLDDSLDELIEAASDLIEEETWIRYRAQTWQQQHWQFEEYIDLEAFPVNEVTITYFDVDDEEQTMPESDYQIITKNKRQYLRIRGAIPSVSHRPDAVTITMECGVASIPKLAKLVCRELVCHWERHREAVIDGRMQTVPHGYERNIQLLRRGRNIA